ncbi:MAG: TolC family protein [Vicinamibacterales bacterium]
MSKYVSSTLVAISLAVTAAAAQAQAAGQTQAQTPPLAQQAPPAVQSMADLVKQATPVAVPPGNGPLAPITLEDAIARALERNIDIAVVRLNPRIRDWDLAAQRASFLPTVTGTVGPSGNTRAATRDIDGGAVITSDTLTYNAGMTQAMRKWGGDLTVNFTNSRQATSDERSIRNPTFSSQLQFRFTQPVLRDFKIDSVRSQIQILQINREVTDLQVKGTIENTLANVRNAYWELVYAIRAIDVAQRSLALSQKLVEDNRIRVEIGTLAPIDIIQAEVQAASAAQALTSAEATWRTAELNLKRLIVGSTEDELWRSRLQPVDQPTVTPQPINAEAAVTRALSERIDLQQDRKALQTNDISILQLENQAKPQLDIQATYGLNATGGPQFDSGVITVPGGYRQTIQQIFQFDYPTWAVQAVASYPIGTTAAKARLASSKIQYEQTQAQVRSRELQVATEVTNAALGVESALKRMEAARLTRELAEKQLEAEASKFEVGMSTNYQIVQFQRDLANARNSELRAILDYQRALVEFERVQSVGGTATGISSIR